MTIRSNAPRLALVAAMLGLLATFVVAPASTAGAQLEGGSCPSSADTVHEGWICSLLLLETPTDAPTDAQVSLWADRLAAEGRVAVADGIVFSDASVEEKVHALYRTELNREPDPDGLAHWREHVQAARTELAVELPIFASGEYLSQFESSEAFVNDQYRYYLGREASRDEQSYWAERFNAGALSNEAISRAIATSAEAGDVRGQLLYRDYAHREPDAAGLQHWSLMAARQGLFPVLVEFSANDEVVHTLGMAGVELAGNPPPQPAPGGDPQQDLVVAPQEVVTTAAGEPVGITVLQRRDGSALGGSIDLALFPCELVTATDSPVPFTDADDDGLADGIASTAADQAYISEVNGTPTGGRALYVDDAATAADGAIRADVVAGPDADCAVIVAFEDGGTARQLELDAQDHAAEPFGVTKVVWE